MLDLGVLRGGGVGWGCGEWRVESEEGERNSSVDGCLQGKRWKGLSFV